MGKTRRSTSTSTLLKLKHVFPRRCQFHGKNHLRTANHYHVFDLGFGRAKRVREHAALGLQRRRRHSLHVRSIEEINTELGERMVSTSERIQQGREHLFHASFVRSSFTVDGHSIPDWNQVRHLCHVSEGRARGDHKTGGRFQSTCARTHCSTNPKAKRFAKAMHASLIFCSTQASINVQKIFKIVLAKAFDLKCVIPEIEGVGEPVLLYVDL